MQARRMFSAVSNPVREQYERWPYPRIPLIARVHREQLWQLNLPWLAARCGMDRPPQKPRIWITGCGTFQPYVFGQANPGAQILASDLSERSLQIAKRRCRFHRIPQVEFQQIDLNEESQYPTGPFDFIECYGVLMSLREPQAVLQRLAARLAPQGILRLMVYPFYSRQRIFQIQRLARLLGLRFENSEHPKLLRQIMASLPSNHPLRYSFFHYHDSKNLEGIVDGFLHASDRGFTGIELCAMADQAGLAPAFYFHRPWGQPEIAAEKFGYGEKHPAFWLHYLDLWQELRTNFTICLVRKDAREKSADQEEAGQRHPLFDLSNRQLGIRHRTRLLRLSLTGVTLSSRTHELPLRLKGTSVRALTTNGKTLSLSNQALEVLPRKRNVSALPAFSRSLAAISPSAALFAPRLGTNSPNPLYSHFFDAYFFDRHWNHSLSHPLPGLTKQIELWQKISEPLEDKSCSFGLTPLGSYSPKDIAAGAESFLGSPPERFQSIQLSQEKKKFQEVQLWLRRFPSLARVDFSPEQLRELWILLFSYPRLTLDFLPASS